MAIIPSISSGDPLVAANWQGGVVPGFGDEAVIAGHDMNLTGSWSVGPDLDAPAILVQSGGSFTSTNGDLTVRGNIDQESDTDVHLIGSTVVTFDAPPNLESKRRSFNL